MSKIDTSSWREYKVGDIFEILLSHSDWQKKDFTGGTIPLVSSGKTNNGVVAKVPLTENAELFKGGCITVDMFGQAFVQQSDFYAVSHGRVNVLKPRIEMPTDALYVICSIPNSNLSGKYDYTKMCTSQRIKEETILLPTKETYEPDWHYMEEYMSGMFDECRKELKNFKKLTEHENTIDVRKWKKFEIQEIFQTVKNGKQVPTGSSVPMNNLRAGKVPRVTVADRNNGIIGYYDTDEKMKIFENFISVSFLGSVFYHPDKASLDMKVHCLKPVKQVLTKETGTFLACAIREQLYGLNYGNQISSSTLPHIVLFLPATPAGEPDWQYMESYMRSVMQEQQANIDFLKKFL